MENVNLYGCTTAEKLIKLGNAIKELFNEFNNLGVLCTSSLYTDNVAYPINLIINPASLNIDGRPVIFANGYQGVITNVGEETFYVKNIFELKGEKGEPGTNGKDGIDGTNGKDGIDGTNGTNGANGKNGAIQAIGNVAITSGNTIGFNPLAYSVSGITNGETIIVLCNSINNQSLVTNVNIGDLFVGTVANYTNTSLMLQNYTKIGNIRGEKGLTGTGITSASSGTPYINGENTITPVTFTYSDGTTQDIGVRAKNGSPTKIFHHIINIMSTERGSLEAYIDIYSTLNSKFTTINDIPLGSFLATGYYKYESQTVYLCRFSKNASNPIVIFDFLLGDYLENEGFSSAELDIFDKVEEI